LKLKLEKWGKTGMRGKMRNRKSSEKQWTGKMGRE